ncbi:MAG: biotin--[acetyl-CoA-carboxylase] ligase [Elusimicrobia bacterium]|nr:biotin--[acetyl-CoA-carboxylase] ligase [Elusimicrobiota bacterium]
MTIALLAYLQEAKTPLSGTALAERMGVSRAAVHKRIEKLRGEGHRITGTNRVGYRWSGAPTRLNPSLLKRGWVKQIFHAVVLGSTQDEAKGRAVAGAPEGTLVLADRQTQGRGRMGRRWVSPNGGLWFSLILRPEVQPDRAPALTLVAALDWVEVLRARGVPAGVKWPNDVWVDGKKIGGILTEMSSEMDRVHWICLGVGMNVNNRLPVGTAVPATSVSAWTGVLSRETLLNEWLARFSRSYARFVRSGFSPFRLAYERRSVLAGARVSFDDISGRREGRVRGMNAEGKLRMAVARGEVLCASGEVNLLRPVKEKKRS